MAVQSLSSDWCGRPLNCAHQSSGLEVPVCEAQQPFDCRSRTPARDRPEPTTGAPYLKTLKESLAGAAVGGVPARSDVARIPAATQHVHAAGESRGLELQRRWPGSMALQGLERMRIDAAVIAPPSRPNLTVGLGLWPPGTWTATTHSGLSRRWAAGSSQTDLHYRRRLQCMVNG